MQIQTQTQIGTLYLYLPVLCLGEGWRLAQPGAIHKITASRCQGQVTKMKEGRRTIELGANGHSIERTYLPPSRKYGLG